MDVTVLITHVKEHLDTCFIKEWFKTAASSIYENQVGNQFLTHRHDCPLVIDL